MEGGCNECRWPAPARRIRPRRFARTRAFFALVTPGGTEADSDRDGAFTTHAEWHAFTHGVYVGFTSKPLTAGPVPDNADVRKEPHYYRGGYLAGTVLQLGVILFTLRYGIGVV